MKNKIVAALTLLVCWSSAGGQASNLTAEETVKRIITTGVIEGHDDKQLSRLGDAAAVAVTKYLGERLARREAITPEDINGALEVLHLAFTAPNIVDVASDREPRTAILLLDFLSTVTTNPTVRTTINSEKAYVLAQFSKSKRG